MSPLAELIKGFGCNQRQADLYAALVRRGPSTVIELAEAISSNRVTTHSAIQELLNKGLAYEFKKGKRRLIAAEDQGGLLKLLEIKSNEVEILKQNTKLATTLFSSLLQNSKDLPAVTFYPGAEGFKKAYEDSLSAKNEFLGCIPIEIMAETLPTGYILNYFKRRAAKKITSRIIWSESPYAKNLYRYRNELRFNAKFFPQDKKWQVGILSWNNVIALLTLTRGQSGCVIIKSDAISYFYRSVIFESLWRQARNIL